MLALNQKVETFDLIQSLEADSGVFKAKGPNGKMYEIVRRPGFCIITESSAQTQAQYSGQQPWQQTQQQQAPWQIRKVAELYGGQGQPQGQHQTERELVEV